MRPEINTAERLQENMRDSVTYRALLKEYGKDVAEHWLGLLEFEKHDSDPIMNLLSPTGRWTLGVSDASEEYLKPLVSPAKTWGDVVDELDAEAESLGTGEIGDAVLRRETREDQFRVDAELRGEMHRADRLL